MKLNANWLHMNSISMIEHELGDIA